MRTGSAKHAVTAVGWTASACTHAGCVRTGNEDRYLVREEQGLFVVADGMGGHDAGDVASTFVTETLADAASATAIEQKLQEANRQLQHRAARTKRGVVGTTVVALLAGAEEFVCFWAGDSRCYLQRDLTLVQVTNDHSLVRQLVDEGRLPAHQAKTYPRANIITRAVGALPDLILERRRGLVRRGDVFLLCSDGLWGVLDDTEIAEIARTAPVASAADALVTLALSRGAPDNVTAVVAARL